MIKKSIIYQDLFLKIRTNSKGMTSKSFNVIYAEIFIALSAGLISFFSPCVLPLIPGYIAFITGNKLEELLEKKNINLLPIFLFTIGFSIVFIIFGASATFLGKFLLYNSFPLRIIAGLIIIIFSLHMLDVFKLNF
ncbi:MAG: hypothetical protein CM1200mP13_09400 [Candidatus Pelagibacterales bacterium]|nr:MAG: hypothetical protein CM1200mP13_09400 [Pelagibacterales bacterium]